MPNLTERGPHRPDLSTLPRYYTWREVFALYNEDEDAFITAWCDGSLPLEVRRSCTETLGPGVIENWLLRRLVRQQDAILQHLTAVPFSTPRART